MRRFRRAFPAYVASLLLALGAATPAASLSCGTDGLPPEEVALTSSFSFVGKIVAVTPPTDDGAFMTQEATIAVAETLRGPKRDAVRVLFSRWCDGECRVIDRMSEHVGASGLFAGHGFAAGEVDDYPKAEGFVYPCGLALWEDETDFADVTASVRRAVAAERPN